MNNYINTLNSIETYYNELEQDDFNFYDDLKNLYKKQDNATQTNK